MIKKHANELFFEYANAHKFICICYEKEVYDGAYTAYESVPEYYFIETQHIKKALSELYNLLKKEKSSISRYPLSPNYDESTNVCINSYMTHKTTNDVLDISFEYEHGNSMTMIITDCSNKNFFSDNVIKKIKKIIDDPQE